MRFCLGVYGFVFWDALKFKHEYSFDTIRLRLIKLIRLN